MADAITINAPRAIAAIAAFGDVSRLSDILQGEFGTAPPETSGWVEAGGVRLSRIAPNRVLVQGDRATNLAARLATLCDGIAAVTDQSDLWHSVTIAGPSAPERLARIVPVDLDQSVFPAGHLALTRGFHVDIRLWRLGDQKWELAVARSHAAYLAHALDTFVAT